MTLLKLLDFRVMVDQNPTFFFQTNTMQAIIVTDEVRTYAIFIYEWMGWTTHTEAGGDTTEGQGGK